MMLEQLRAEVLEANLELVRQGLVLYTFGNASGISRADGLLVIKPSGVPYESMQPADLVVTDLEGRTVEGELALRVPIVQKMAERAILGEVRRMFDAEAETLREMATLV